MSKVVPTNLLDHIKLMNSGKEFKLNPYQEMFIRDIYGLKSAPETPYEIARRYYREYVLGERERGEEQ
jgi:hypothetical protein